MESGIPGASAISFGYYDPFNVYAGFQSAFAELLPLRGLRWKYHPSKPLKSIDSLPLHFIEEVPKPTKSARVSGDLASFCDLHEVIYVRIMFVLFDSLSSYRSQVRPLIKEWLKHSVLPSNSEWMIIFQEGSSSKSLQSYIIKKTGFEKLKVDFGPGGKEFASLPRPCDMGVPFQVLKVSDRNSGNVESYGEVIAAFKSLLLRSFDKKYNQIDNTKPLSTSDPHNDLVSKLSLSCLLRDMHILQDALELFAELSKDVDTVYSSAPDQFDSSYGELSAEVPEFSSSGYSILRLDQSKLRTDEKLNLFYWKSFIFANVIFILNNEIQQAQSQVSKLSLTSAFLSRVLDHCKGLCVIFHCQPLTYFCFALIERYLKMPISKIEDAEKNLMSDVSRVYNDTIALRGELRHLQRSLFLELGTSRGYHVDKRGCFQESISMEEPSTSCSRSIVTEPFLETALSSLASFVQYYEELTELVLKDYITCGRNRLADMLSIDMALIKFRRGQYRECADILCDSFDFFLEARWEYLGGYILEVYIECLEQLLPTSNEDLVVCYLKSLGNFKNHAHEENSGSNNYWVSKPVEQIKDLMHKLERQTESLGNPICYQADKLFGVDFSGSIRGDQSTSLDRYYIELILDNPFPISVKLHSICLDMKSSDRLERISFTASGVALAPNSVQRIQLQCNEFKQSVFTPVKMDLMVFDNLLLEHRFAKDIEDTEFSQDPDDTVINYPVIKQPRIVPEHLHSPCFFFEADPTKLWCELKPPLKYDLGFPSVILRIHNSKNLIENCEIQLISASAGFNIVANPLDLKLLQIEAGHDIDITLPFENQSGLSQLKIAIKMTYYVAGLSFSYALELSVDTALQISVSVHDVFKTEYIFSKFSIAPPDGMLPIKVFSTELVDKNANYDISLAQTQLSAAVALVEQPYTSFYRICPKLYHVVKPDDIFNLSVKYVRLQDECTQVVDDLLKKSLIDKGLLNFYFPIRHRLLKIIRYDALKFSTEKTIVILNRVAVASSIREFVTQLTHCPNDSAKLATALSEILLDNPEFHIPLGMTLEVKEINIEVAVPLLDILHVVDLDFDKRKCYTVGEAIDTTLRIHSTRRWGCQKVPLLDGQDPSARSATQDTYLENNSKFQATITSDENWLISGFKRSCFQLSPDLDSLFETKLALIPLGIGKLRLPRISIRSTSVKPEERLMEIESGSILEAVLVLSDLESLTFTF